MRLKAPQGTSHRMVQAPERGPWALVASTSPLPAAAGGGSPSAGVGSLSPVCFDREKDRRLKSESCQADRGETLICVGLVQKKVHVG